jgi:hypothetical protein
MPAHIGHEDFSRLKGEVSFDHFMQAYRWSTGIAVLILNF